MATIAGHHKPPSGGDFGGDDFDGGWNGGRAPGSERRGARTGMYLALIGITMMFVAFSSAYVVRAGLSDDWQAIELPRLLWLNTAILLLSSVTTEEVRKSLRDGMRQACNRWLLVTTILRATFLVLQLV